MSYQLDNLAELNILRLEYLHFSVLWPSIKRVVIQLNQIFEQTLYILPSIWALRFRELLNSSVDSKELIDPLMIISSLKTFIDR